MATVTGMTAERMQEIEDASVVDGAVDVAGDLTLYQRDGTPIAAGNVKGPVGDTGTAAPTGGMVLWPTETPPANWLLCEGQAVSRTTYNALFAVLGTTYGAGDGSTTFNLPNMKGRVVVGLDPAQTEFDTMGETGGAKTHTLTEAEMPSHTHVQNPHDHDMTVRTSSTAGGAAPMAGSVSGSGGTDTSNIQNTTAVNQNTGGGGAHNNLQPYIVLRWMVKT
jgi:microcystin-dependent protein